MKMSEIIGIAIESYEKNFGRKLLPSEREMFEKAFMLGFGNAMALSMVEIVGDGGMVQ